MITCNKCFENKEETEFYRRDNSKLRLSCKKCDGKASYACQRKRRAKNRKQPVTDPINKIKKCPKCNIRKSFSDFYKNAGEKYGISCYCLECNRKIMKRVTAFRRKINNGYIISEKQYNEILLKFNSKCVYCFLTLPIVNVVWDHYIPISKSGENTVENVVPSCLKCNREKHSKMPEEFLNWKINRLFAA